MILLSNDKDEGESLELFKRLEEMGEMMVEMAKEGDENREEARSESKEDLLDRLGGVGGHFLRQGETQVELGEMQEEEGFEQREDYPLQDQVEVEDWTKIRARGLILGRFIQIQE